MIQHVYISTVIHNPIFYTHTSAHIPTDSFLTLLYILKEFFQQIRKFDSWSNHFVWKDMLPVTVSVSSRKFRTYRRPFIKYGKHTTTLDMPIPLYFATS